MRSADLTPVDGVIVVVAMSFLVVLLLLGIGAWWRDVRDRRVQRRRLAEELGRPEPDDEGSG